MWTESNFNLILLRGERVGCNCPELPLQHHNRGWELGLHLQPRDQVVVNPVEGSDVPPQLKKASWVKSNIKSMLICILDQEGIVHKEYIPSGQTLNADFCLEVLRCLWEDVRLKRPNKWHNKTWPFYHDNVPAHTTIKSPHSHMHVKKNHIVFTFKD